MANAPLLNSINTLSTSGDFTAPDNELGVKGLFALKLHTILTLTKPGAVIKCSSLCAPLLPFSFHSRAAHLRRMAAGVILLQLINSHLKFWTDARSRCTFYGSVCIPDLPRLLPKRREEMHFALPNFSRF